MPTKLVHVRMSFPEIANASVEAIANQIRKDLESDGSIEYAGYMKDDELERDLIQRLGEVEGKTYQRPTVQQLSVIKGIVTDAFQKAWDVLPLSETPAYVFIFPWFPEKNTGKDFGGVNAVAVHDSVMHLFISPTLFTKRSLLETVVHEYNHLAYYARHQKSSYTLLEKMLMEGLAEKFREHVVGGEVASWSVALSPIQVKAKLTQLDSRLTSKSRKLADEILFGSDSHQRWTGYAIGYFLVSKYQQKTPVEWENLMRVRAKSFLT